MTALWQIYCRVGLFPLKNFANGNRSIFYEVTKVGEVVGWIVDHFIAKLLLKPAAQLRQD